MDSDEFENDEEKMHLSDENVEEADNFEFKSLDKTMILKQLKAFHVKVHVDNLVEPNESHKVRNLNESHVISIVNSMKLSMCAYTTLIGLTSDDSINLEELHTPGVANIEVLGGNHTRAALVKIKEESPEIFNSDENFQYVYMDIYSGISDDQSLCLGYEHNIVHESSKQMCFQEKVILFHKVLVNCTSRFDGLSDKTIHGKWRSELSALVNKSKKDLNHCFKTHLVLARCSGLTWTFVEKLFEMFNKGVIKRQRSKDKLTQYSFTKFSKVKTADEKQTLLKRVVDGELSLEEFKGFCVSGNRTTCTGKEDDQRKANNSMNMKNRNSQGETLEELEKLKNELQKEIENKNELMHLLKIKDGELKTKGKLLEDVTQEKQKMENEHEEHTKVMTVKLLKYKAFALEAKKQADSLKMALETEKARCEAAEEAASRAREVNGKSKTINQTKTSTKISCNRQNEGTHEDKTKDSLKMARETTKARNDSVEENATIDQEVKKSKTNVKNKDSLKMARETTKAKNDIAEENATIDQEVKKSKTNVKNKDSLKRTLETTKTRCGTAEENTTTDQEVKKSKTNVTETSTKKDVKRKNETKHNSHIFEKSSVVMYSDETNYVLEGSLKKSIDTEEAKCDTVEDAARVKEENEKSQAETSTKGVIKRNIETQHGGETECKEADLAIVEYINGHVYIGMVEGNILTYCQKPIGSIQNESFLHQPTKLSFVLNKRDQQTFDKTYVIVNVKGTICGEQIKFDDLSLPIDKMFLEINNYIQSNLENLS